MPPSPDRVVRSLRAFRAARAAALAALLAAASVILAAASPAAAQRGGLVSVAVAANFTEAQQELARRIQAETGIEVRASPGATGQLYAQIHGGAPFDVFLSADTERVAMLERDGLTAPGTRFTYAEGRLTLYSPGQDMEHAGAAALRGSYAHLAIANPKTAPYGAAAVEAMAKLGVRAVVGDRVVQGESITQTLQFVRSGSAELGFVALSQVVREPRRSYWLVPRELHTPILQDAVLLARGAGNDAARRYIAFLRGAEAKRIIESYGYTVPQ